MVELLSEISKGARNVKMSQKDVIKNVEMLAKLVPSFIETKLIKVRGKSQRMVKYQRGGQTMTGFQVNQIIKQKIINRNDGP